MPTTTQRRRTNETIFSAQVLHDQWKLDFIAVGHCTGEPEFAALRKEFGEKDLYAGVGTTVEIP